MNGLFRNIKLEYAVILLLQFTQKSRKYHSKASVRLYFLGLLTCLPDLGSNKNYLKLFLSELISVQGIIIGFSTLNHYQFFNINDVVSPVLYYL